MASEKGGRRADSVLADIEEAAAAAAELVARGKSVWKKDRLIRFAGEAIIGRLADAAGRLPEGVKTAIPDVPWDDIRDIRILVDHIYHRIDYEILWRTLKEDVPHLRRRLEDFRGATR
jgi:uncharacterized protein with HEPN domain